MLPSSCSSLEARQAGQRPRPQRQSGLLRCDLGGTLQVAARFCAWPEQLTLDTPDFGLPVALAMPLDRGEGSRDLLQPFIAPA